MQRQFDSASPRTRPPDPRPKGETRNSLSRGCAARSGFVLDFCRATMNMPCSHAPPTYNASCQSADSPTSASCPVPYPISRVFWASLPFREFPASPRLLVGAAGLSSILERESRSGAPLNNAVLQQAHLAHSRTWRHMSIRTLSRQGPISRSPSTKYQDGVSWALVLCTKRQRCVPSRADTGEIRGSTALLAPTPISGEWEKNS
jgi:hypothetical protein